MGVTPEEVKAAVDVLRHDAMRWAELSNRMQAVGECPDQGSAISVLSACARVASSNAILCIIIAIGAVTARLDVVR